MLRGHPGSQVWHLELRFWRSSGKRPWTCPLFRLRFSHFKDHGISRDQVSSICGRYSTLHGCLLLGSIPNGGSHDVCRLWRFLNNGLQLNSGKFEAMILGSRQVLFRLEPVALLDIGDGRMNVKDEINILGKKFIADGGENAVELRNPQNQPSLGEIEISREDIHSTRI